MLKTLTTKLAGNTWRTQGSDGQPVGNDPAPAPATAQPAGQLGGQQDPTPAVSGNDGDTQQPKPVVIPPELQPVLDGIIADRLARAKKGWDDDAKAKAARANMAEAERAAADLRDATARAEAAELRANQAEWRADLTLHVVDTNGALKLIDPEKHLDANGKVNPQAFLRDYPYMRRDAGPTGPGTGGRQGTDVDPLSSLAAAEAADRRAGRR